MLRIDDAGPVRSLTLDRPDVRNAFNDELIAQLTAAVQSAPAGTRVIVLRGEGKAFSAGGDLEWMRRAATYTRQQNAADAVKLAGLFAAIAESPAVVVARVHGPAFGGGCGLVCASDVAIASPAALFSFSEVKLGLIPATISTYVIPKIGAGHARALFVTGEAFGADHALRIGLVHQVVPAEDLDDAVDRTVAMILKNGPLAVAESKKLALTGPYPVDEAAALLAEARAREEGREGVTAFLDKRTPSFAVEWPPKN